MSTQSSPEQPIADARRTRASDDEREEIVKLLRAAMSEGRLSLEEGEARMSTAYSATYREELTPLTRDLPGGGWQALADTPEVKAFFRRHLRRHAFFTVALAGMLIFVWAMSGAHFFWPAIPLAFLLFGLIARIRFYRYARWAGFAGRAAWAARGGWPGGPWRGHGWR